MTSQLSSTSATLAHMGEFHYHQVNFVCYQKLICNCNYVFLSNVMHTRNDIDQKKTIF